MPYDRVLSLIGDDDCPGLFVIGSFAKRVTIYSQQVRSINLVDALHFYRYPLSDKHVAIIGAGAAGLTAAARVLQHGGSVTLFEQTDDVMSIQQKSKHRWLHPTIYDWPFVDIGRQETDDARLPVMNWSADYANEIAVKLKAEWVSLVKKFSDRAKLIMPARITEAKPISNGFQISFIEKPSGEPRNRTEQFPILILAVGFGLEPSGQGRIGYWEQDPLEYLGRLDQHVLIAGYGDGALTDLMCVCLRDFDHKGYLLRLSRAISDEELTRIRKIESDPQAADAGFLSQHYNELCVPGIIEIVEPLAITGRRVVLTGPGGDLFDPRASALNRLIASQLLHIGAFTHSPLEMEERINDDAQDDPAIARIQEKYSINFATVLRRFGPDPSIDKILGLERMLTKMEDKWEKVRPADDPTRRPLWDEFTPITEAVENCCITFHPIKLDPSVGGIRNVINNAVSRLQKSNNISLRSRHASVEDSVRSEKALAHATRVLCRAPVVIFLLGPDMGQANPAGMLLLGIRAAVRRGITLVIHDATSELLDWNALPFNLKEQQVRSLKISPESLDELHKSLASGLDILQKEDAGYRDLPVFDIIRRPTRRTPPSAPGRIEVLVLCPFSEEYSSGAWSELKVLTDNVANGILDLKRVVDETSPLLVSERLYELTRFSNICLADWTEWRANVFFELGVRLATNPMPPICIVQHRLGFPLTGQQQALQRLFSPIQYSFGAEPGAGAEEFQKSLDIEIKSRSFIPESADSVHGTAQRNVFIEQEYGHISYEELVLQQVESIIGSDFDRLGRLMILYGLNEGLRKQVSRGAIDALTAAWLLAKKKAEWAPAGDNAQAHRRIQESIESRLTEILDLELEPWYQKYRSEIEI